MCLAFIVLGLVLGLGFFVLGLVLGMVFTAPGSGLGFIVLGLVFTACTWFRFSFSGFSSGFSVEGLA